ncbi:MAG: hypothetical protein GF414_08595 [Candidatus Altiarchaeales archaeon]|nr:hypothetical protein [Candidatus Altiarchaeales archaeon]
MALHFVFTYVGASIEEIAIFQDKDKAMESLGPNPKWWSEGSIVLCNVERRGNAYGNS